MTRRTSWARLPFLQGVFVGLPQFSLIVCLLALVLPSNGAPLFLQPGAISYSALLSPEAETETGSFTQIFAGENHTCAVFSNGGLWCWGLGSSGQLGNGNASSSSLPLKVQIADDAAQLGAGGGVHTCVINASKLWCWGVNTNGQLGMLLGTQTFLTPQGPLAFNGRSEGVTQVSTGNGHTCAVVLREVWCWGVNEFGERGTGTSASVSMPLKVDGTLSNVSHVSAGASRTCAINSGQISCWGFVLGVSNASPTQMPFGGSSVRHIEVGYGGHNCYTMTTGTLYCLGENNFGQIGNGTTSTVGTATPSEVVGLSNVSHIALGASHSCAVSNNNSVWCWGNNGFGQLGNGTTTNSSLPVRVGLPSGMLNITGLAAGRNHTCALANGNVWCWGSHSNFQLGDGDRAATFKPSPVRVSDGVIRQR